MPEVDYAGEGTSDLVVARKLIQLSGAIVGRSYDRPGRGAGKARLDARLSGLNAGAAYGRIVLALRDLDDDEACAGDLVRRLVPLRNEGMLLRIAVRSAEAWYIADAQAYANYCGMKVRALPVAPEDEPSLKRSLIRWADDGVARRLKLHLAESRSRRVPDWAALGQWHAEFVRSHWSPARAIASGRVPSLERALGRLRERVTA